MSVTPDNAEDFLWRNISSLPFFRGLLRAVEARFYQQFDIKPPVLDLGCGDGHFTSVTFKQKFDVGVDPWIKPLRQAVRRQCYQVVLRGDGCNLPFPRDYFNTIISNSVLEHIVDLEPVLEEAARVLKPDGLLIFCVPSNNFLNNLSIGQFLDQIRLHTIAGFYRNWFNGISRHYHCDPSELWQVRLEKAGFQCEKYWHYFSPRATHVLEWGHFLGLPSLITQQICGNWIVVPSRWNLALTMQLVKPIYDEEATHPSGSYTFYVARRRK